MNGISKETKKLFRKFCIKLTVEYPKSEFTEKSKSYMVGPVPDDIKIDRFKGNNFILYDEYYLLYREVLAELRSETCLEYLKDRELKDALWHFTCEIIADYKTYRDSNKLKKKIDVFLDSLSKPLEDYEVLIPILYLIVKDSEFTLDDVIIKKLDETFLKEYGIRGERNALHKKYFEEIVNKTGAIILEKGNNPELVCERAREKADFIIRILQTSLSTNRQLHDENVLFKQNESIFFRKKDIPSSVRGYWQRSYKPIPIEIDKNYENSINKFLSNIPEVLEEGKLPQKFRTLFVRALIWIGRGIEEEEPDIKIINLSTALETILTTLNDKRKGEALASRMLLLNAIVDKPFFHPAEVMRIYELRSKIVHGSELNIASKYEYLTMLYVVNDALLNSIEVIRTKGLKSHKKFIETLESNDKKEKILNWLEEQVDEGSLQIKEYMEKSR